MSSSKFIKAIPKPIKLDAKSPSSGIRIYCSEIYYTEDPSKRIEGLVVMAKSRFAPPPLANPTPSAALECFGNRIRGLNYEPWHDNPDGSVVRGWHEHVWSPKEDDGRVVAARPEPKQKSMIGLFRWGLTQWNIALQLEQGELYDD